MATKLALDFIPDPRRASAAVEAMNVRLGRSLRHIRDRASPHITLPAGRIEAVLADLHRGQRMKPVLFGIHADLLDAVHYDDMATLESLFDELDQRNFAARHLAIRPFTREEFGERDMERYRRHAASDPDIDFDLMPPDRQEFERFARDVRAALAILDASAPDVAGELRAITAEITVATHDPARTTFDGISAFGLWGGLIINPNTHRTLLDVLEVLVHESTHTLLFAYCLDEPLVHNPNADRYASPVRRDPRPMDGLFHGTYVLARIHYALGRVVQAGVLSRDDRTEAEERLSCLGEQFFMGIGPIKEHARFTDTGREVFASAERYMSQTAL